ncbi:hypothetical protein ACEPAG_9333 [Sanghuangporus baumii]
MLSVIAHFTTSLDREEEMDPVSQIRGSSSSSSLPSSPAASVKCDLKDPRSPVSDAATLSRSRSCSREQTISPLSTYSDDAYSPAQLASSIYFDEWRHGTALTMPLSISGGTRWDAFPVPQAVRNLGNYLLDVRLPEWIYESDSRIPSTRISPLPGVRLTDMYVEEDAAFKTSFERIIEESAELARLNKQQIRGSGMNWRLPVDNMIRKAFVKPRTVPNISSPAECDFICEVVFCMPHSSAPIAVQKTVIADTLVSTSLYPSPSMFELDSQIFEELRVDKERHDSPVVCIPHLVVQHVNGSGSRDSALRDATNELHFLFGAGMHQRKLLGFEKEPMFGIACSDGKARAFASYWKDNQVISMIALRTPLFADNLVQIQIVHLYADDLDLQMTEQACLFFVLLLRIRHLISTFVSELETVDGGAIEGRIRGSERSWKAQATYPSPPDTSWPSPPSGRQSSLSMTRRPDWSTSSESSTFPDEIMDLDDSPGSVASESVASLSISASA